MPCKSPAKYAHRRGEVANGTPLFFACTLCLTGQLSFVIPSVHNIFAVPLSSKQNKKRDEEVGGRKLPPSFSPFGRKWLSFDLLPIWMQQIHEKTQRQWWWTREREKETFLCDDIFVQKWKSCDAFAACSNTCRPTTWFLFLFLPWKTARFHGLCHVIIARW